MSTQTPAKSIGQIAAERIGNEAIDYGVPSIYYPGKAAQIIDSVIDSASLRAAGTGPDMRAIDAAVSIAHEISDKLAWYSRNSGEFGTVVAIAERAIERQLQRSQPVQGLEQIAREAVERIPFLDSRDEREVEAIILRACQAAASAALNQK